MYSVPFVVLNVRSPRLGASAVNENGVTSGMLEERWIEESARLRQAGTPFVLATVVAREAPQSARVGAHALVTADGGMEGWIGGGCVRPTIVREALAALAEGAPRLVRMSPGAAPDPRPEVRVYPLTCQGEGSVDVYLEPVMPAPVLVVLGVSRVAHALAAQAPAVGLVPALHDVAALPAGDEGVLQLIARLNAASSDPALRYVVVATMGEGDEEALEAAVAAETAYVGLVASRKKAEALMAYLRSRGVPVERMRQVRAPAGLDLGAATPGEIALSILAEVVQRRRRPSEPGAAMAPARAPQTHGSLPEPAQAQEPLPAMPPRSPAPLPILGAPDPGVAEGGGPGMAPATGGAASPTAVDPVCGMTVDVATARYTLTLLDGRAYWFCCAACRTAFQREPERYVAASFPVL